MRLSEYVLKRNGVPLGSRDSLRNMLVRSLGAASFDRFWTYWNPIWGYYLGYRIFRPLQKVLPQSLALLVTFLISGAVHDLAIMLVKREPVLLLTPWFGFMCLAVLAGRGIGLSYGGLPWLGRAAFNLSIIVACYLPAHIIRHEFF